MATDMVGICTKECRDWSIYWHKSLTGWPLPLGIGTSGLPHISNWANSRYCDTGEIPQAEKLGDAGCWGKKPSAYTEQSVELQMMWARWMWVEASVKSVTNTCDLRCGTLQGRSNEVTSRSEEVSCFPWGHWLCSSGKRCPTSEPTHLAFHLWFPVI